MSAFKLTIIYEQVLCSIIMKTQTIQTTKQNTWNKMVHAPFKKVVAFDLICMGIGAVIGMGIGAYLVIGA